MCSCYAFARQGLAVEVVHHAQLGLDKAIVSITFRRPNLRLPGTHHLLRRDAGHH